MPRICLSGSNVRSTEILYEPQGRHDGHTASAHIVQYYKNRFKIKLFSPIFASVIIVSNSSDMKFFNMFNGNRAPFNVGLSPVLLLIALLLAAGCRERVNSRNQDVEATPQRGVYFWKSVFLLNDSETAFLQDHNVKRLYLKMFDVAPDRDWDSGEIGVFPIATTKFVSPVPEGISVVPAVYITLEALRHSIGNEEKLAHQIVERVLAMVSFHKLGPVGMVQFDCDWTSSTRSSYSEEYYPFDHSVLIMYEVGCPCGCWQ